MIETFIKTAKENNIDKIADIIVFPMFFSANHAIELYLKSINWSLNMLLDKNETYCGGHDIRQIWNNVKKRMTEYEKNKKLNHDPRITKIGKILRKTSLDEFPQFINVLKWDLSIIGPRPLVEGELDEHNGNHEIYESVRPGITGWWAANGRSAIDYEKRLELEYYYCKNCSLWLDIKCFFKTIEVVLFKRGAK